MSLASSVIIDNATYAICTGHQMSFIKAAHIDVTMTSRLVRTDKTV